MAKLSMREKISIHRQRELEAVELGMSYARTEHYEDAAMQFHAAEFHRAMVAELKSMKH